MANEPVITVTGNLGADAESKVTKGGLPVTSFSIASTPRKQVNGEWIDGDTLWFRISLWQDTSEQPLHKGTKVKVTGRLAQTSWVDKAGTTNKSLEINTDSFEIVPKTGGSSESAQKAPDNFEW